MKVAVAASGNDLNAATDPRFGRCPWFVMVNADTMQFEAFENPAVLQGSGAGIAAAQLVANAGADAVIAANVGPNAHQALSAGGIAVFAFAGGTVKDAVEGLKSGSLPQTAAANVPSHFGMGAGMAGGKQIGLKVGQPQGQADALKSQADAVEAQLTQLRRQIDELQDKASKAG